MDCNQFSKKLEELQAEHDRISANLAECSSDISWFAGFDAEKTHEELMSTRRRMEAMRGKLEEAQQRGFVLRSQVKKLEDQASLGFDPRHWFSSERAVAVRQLDRTKESLKKCVQEREELEFCVRDDEQAANQLNAGLMRHRSFDPLCAQATRQSLQAQLEQLQPQLLRLRQRKEDLDAKIKVLQVKLSALRQERDLLNYEIARAEKREQALSRAKTGKERSQIHSKCENEFGNSSPRKALQSMNGKLKAIEAKIEKQEKRLHQVTMFAQHDIRTLVLDGNNLCYQQGKFIGFAALEVLIPVLAAKYTITLIFDSDIRGIMRLGDDDIRNIFPQASAVHVVPAGKKADATILNVAGDDRHSFVISNDQFDEYPEKAAVCRQHIIRHSIVENKVLIDDLDVSVEFNSIKRNRASFA